MNILSTSHSESSPHIHDFTLRLNSSDSILVRVNLTSPSARVSHWLDMGGEISPCPIEWSILLRIVEEALRREIASAR